MPNPPIAQPDAREQEYNLVLAIVNFPREAPSVELKSSAPWDDLKIAIIKTCMAMSNLKGGGNIILGICESRESYECTGVSEEHFASYDVDSCKTEIDKYSDPHIDVIIYHVVYNDKKFIVFSVSEFADTPVVCARNHEGYGMREGDMYCRPSSRNPRTERVCSSKDFREIVDLAAFKSAQKIVTQSSDLIGSRDRFPFSDEDDSHYENEAGEM